jgi:hypothetical protein
LSFPYRLESKPRHWIPAFTGMTELRKQVFTVCTGALRLSIDVCHWLCQCFPVNSTGRASGTQERIHTWALDSRLRGNEETQEPSVVHALDVEHRAMVSQFFRNPLETQVSPDPKPSDRSQRVSRRHGKTPRSPNRNPPPDQTTVQKISDCRDFLASIDCEFKLRSIPFDQSTTGVPKAVARNPIRLRVPK